MQDSSINFAQEAPPRPPMARWQPSPPAGGDPDYNGRPPGIQPARRPTGSQAPPEAETSGAPGDPRNGHYRARTGGGTAVDETAPKGPVSARVAGKPAAPAQPESNGRGKDDWKAGFDESAWDEEDEEYDEEEAPRILVLDRVGELSTDIARATVDLDPAPEVLRLSRATQVIEVVEQEEPDIVVVAPAEMTGAGLKRLARIHQADPELVILLSATDRDLPRSQIAASGGSDVIPEGVSKARLRAKIVKAIDTIEERRAEPAVADEPDTDEVMVRRSDISDYEPPHAEPEPAPAPRRAYEASVPSYAPAQVRPPVRSAKLARVFTVASASGGCGKTFYSTNFAAYLAKATRSKVLLVDLDLQFGEVAISLHLRPKRTISELIQEEDILAALSDYVVDHSAGYQVLCAPRDPVAGDRVGPRETTMVLEAARTVYDYIVVDTPPSLNETCLAAFDQSQSLVIMATMDLPSLKNLRVFLETLKKLNLPADQVSLIVNKAEAGTGIDLREVEPLYPQGFSAVLPYAKQVSWSINMGMPVLVADPGADISRKLVEGARKMVPPVQGAQTPWTAPAVAPRKGWFSRLLKGKAR